MNQPTISVLMAVYNGEKYLKEAIESILVQTFVDFEFIIIDDASTDRSGVIIRSYNDPRIRLIKNEKNLGLTISLNKGLLEAQGKYVARMDADDISKPFRLERQYEFMENNPSVVLVGSWAETIDKNGVVSGLRKVPVDPEMIKFELVWKNCFFHSSVCFRKKEIISMGCYDENYRYVQDYDLFSRLTNTYLLANIPQALIQWRAHDRSVVGSPHSQKIVRDNTLEIIRSNIRNYTNLSEHDFNILKKTLILRELDSSVTFYEVSKALLLNRKIYKDYKKKISKKESKKISVLYKNRRRQIFKRYLAAKYALTKKLTPHNLFVKWPTIARNRARERMRNNFMRFFLFRKNPIILTDKYEIRFVLYPWDRTPIESLLSRRIFDNEFKALEKLIGKGNLIFDIGAHRGLHSVMFGRWSGDDGIVYAFEPVPSTYNLLCETLALNHSYNVLPQNLGFLEKTGRIKINIFEDTNSSWNSFGHPVFKGVSAKEKVLVSVESVDNFCKKNNIKRIHFMKVDVEGFEKSVFEGARQMLEDGLIDYISFEISQIPLAGNNARAKEVFDILSSFGYRSYRFDVSTDRFTGPYEDSEEFHENYYASRHNLIKHGA